MALRIFPDLHIEKEHAPTARNLLQGDFGRV